MVTLLMLSMLNVSSSIMSNYYSMNAIMHIEIVSLPAKINKLSFIAYFIPFSNEQSSSLSLAQSKVCSVCLHSRQAGEVRSPSPS